MTQFSFSVFVQALVLGYTKTFFVWIYNSHTLGHPMTPFSVSIYHTASCFVDVTCTGQRKAQCCAVNWYNYLIMDWYEEEHHWWSGRCKVVVPIDSFRLGYFRLNWLVYYHAGCNTLLYWERYYISECRLFIMLTHLYLLTRSQCPTTTILLYIVVLYLFYSSSIQCRIADEMSAMALTMAHATTTLKR